MTVQLKNWERMGKEKKHARSTAEGLIPELRFPECINDVEWVDSLGAKWVKYFNDKIRRPQASFFDDFLWIADDRDVRLDDGIYLVELLLRMFRQVNIKGSGKRFTCFFFQITANLKK